MQEARVQSFCTFRCVSPPGPGAIAMFVLCGAVHDVLASLTGRRIWREGVPRYTRFGEVDRGIAFVEGEERAWLMPHGGPHIIARLHDLLLAVGATPADEPSGLAAFPEARDECEALMLAAIARLEGELGLDLLLDQPRRWRAAREVTQEDRDRSARLNRLFHAPLVVVAGAANVGKSTLSNRLAGRSMSIEADLPGTTRDYVAARVNLRGLIVNWVDTPGLREAGDEIEEEAIALASEIIRSADCLIAMTDRDRGWPDLGRQPDLRIVNKADRGLPPHGDTPDLLISALTGEGLSELVLRVRALLVPQEDLEAEGLWVFDERLRPGRALA